MKAVSSSFVLVLALALSAIPVQAHHTWPVNMSELITVQGTVTAFDWSNPHPMISLDVVTADGATEKWQVGGPAINRMEAKGWTKQTVKPGDVITGEGYRFSDGQKIVRLEKITFADGREMKLYGR